MKVFDLLNLYLGNVRVVLFDVCAYSNDLLDNVNRSLNDYVLKDNLKDIIVLNDNNNYRVVNFSFDDNNNKLVIYCDKGVK